MLNWLFRPQCIACGDPSDTLCDPCGWTLEELGPSCERCAEPGERVCARCAVHPLPLDHIVSPWRFGGQLAVALRRLKLANRPHIARDIAPMWAPLLAAAAVVHDAIVVPVPTHWRRRMSRGYDHTWLLARYACASQGIAPPIAALRRPRASAPQSSLSAAERRANLIGGFAVCAPVEGKNVVLVDDVVTTGATLSAAALALQVAGARRVIGVSVARSTSARG